MAVPQRKISKSRKNLRRAHDAMKTPSLGRCPRCSQAVRPHHVCPNCGHYRGRKIVDREGI